MSVVGSRYKWTASEDCNRQRGASVSYTYLNDTVKRYVNKQTPWPLVRKRTIPTERPQIFGEIYFQLFRIEVCRVVSAADPPLSLILVF
jgi:hypothetical protein